MWKRTTILTAVMAVLGFLAAGTGALAERPPGAGPPVDEGNEPPDYGDLFILYRDPGGLPYLTADSCVQPVSEDTWEGCETVDDADSEHDGKCLVPVDPGTCGVIGEYAIYTEEVEFGRINEARSPDDVFEAQLNEVILNLATAGCIDLDPAGRLVYSSLTDEGTVSATTDSPLQQLAIYRQLMKFGALSEGIELPDEPLHMAARAAGGAMDKGGEGTVDLFVYLNEVLGLTEDSSPSILPRVCIPIKQEVMGVIKMVPTCFLDYSGFTYSRLAKFGGLPERPYVPMDDPVPGYFEYLALTNPDPPMFEIEQGPITTAVFQDEVGFDGGNIRGFAQEADDARAVIEFMHMWPVPEEFESTLTCDVSADIYYDVSISDVSGLQVPVRMVAGTEGREGTVTVVNGGPAEATGTVMVTGVYEDADGEDHFVTMVKVEAGLPTEEPIFAEPEEFTLLPGRSQSWIFYFSMEEATTIDWTAHAEAELDVVEENNTVTEKTVVTGPKGGGSGGH